MSAALLAQAQRLAPPTIVVDTREQAPWTPRIRREGRCVLLPVVRRALVAGDYTIEGYEQEIAIERKSLEDWVGTMFGKARRADGSEEPSWDRFRRELGRALAGVEAKGDEPAAPPLQRFAVIVEGSRADVHAHRYRSQVHPNSVIGRSDSVFTDHGVPVIFAGSRQEAERLGIWTLVRWWEGRQRMGGATEKDIAAALRAIPEGPPPDTRVPAGMRPIAEQMDADQIGLGMGRPRKAPPRRMGAR